MTADRLGIYLLASYPKSGNTWVRALIESFSEGGETLDINRMTRVPGIMDRRLFDGLFDIDSGDLTVEELNRARPAMHRILAQETTGVRWYKSHDANLPAPGADDPPFPPDALGGVVLIARDPRDVAPSMADHGGRSIDRSIEVMADERYLLSKMNPFSQLPHLVSSWSSFYRSWLDARDIRIMLLRYEDLSREPERSLRAVLSFAGLEPDETRIRKAVELARFDNLARQEDQSGFRERSPKALTRFFRHGRVGAWRDVLTAEQADRIIQDHGPMMARLGYSP